MSAKPAPRLALLLILVAGVVFGPDANAYLKLGARIDSRVVALKWSQQPVRYFVTNRDVPGVTAVQLRAALERAFRAWTDQPSASISTEFVGFTSADPSVDDNMSVIGFRSRPDLDRTLGATTWQLDNVTGQLLEMDIFLNSIFNWSVAAAGEPSRFDVESISVHEIGHLLGLGHSALGETELQPTGGRRILGKRAVMFPIAYAAGSIKDRTLEADDIAGISDIYPASTITRETGAISGRVTLGPAGVFGAHVTAFNLSTGALVGGFSLNTQGDFVIAGLAPGMYVVRVEPLDDAETDSFFDESALAINFRPAYYERLVAVPIGGTSGSIEIKVQAK